MTDTYWTRTDADTVIGVFENPAAAERALSGLREAGFVPDQVSVIARDTEATRTIVRDTGMGDDDGAAGGGALAGAAAGGIIGWLVGISALVIPGIGPIVGAGVLASTLIGAAAGGLIGALAGLGVPEEDARHYETHVSEGRILLTVRAIGREQTDDARDIFQRFGGADVRAYGSSSRPVITYDDTHTERPLS